MSRTLVVTNDFPTRQGGIESFVYALADRLPPDEVVVYTASMPGDREFDELLAFPVVRDKSSMLLPTPLASRRIAAVLRAEGCDSVLFGAAGPLGLLADGLRAAGAQRVVGLTHGHETWWARVPAARRALRRIGDACDVLTYVSEFCRRRIASALSDDVSKRMQRLAPGVDTEVFRPGVGGAA
ncbi:MAG TPA: glycosyltransferase family 4 protein, partial [Jiangellaceae bacterium]|nr:glycosyltransferase family 4 protein [Jiangellaceae bacterium]